MTALTSARSVASAAAARISSRTWTLSAFIFGRSRRIVPMPPSTSSRTNSPIGSGLARRDGVLGQPGLEEEADALEDVVDRERHEDVEVGVRRDDVLGRDDGALLDERELDDVELHREVVAAGEALVAVGRHGLGELPLAEEADDGEVTLGDAREQRRARTLVVDDRELDVAVAVDARLDAEALEDRDDTIAHRGVGRRRTVRDVTRGARHEVGQGGRVGHAHHRRLIAPTDARWPVPELTVATVNTFSGRLLTLPEGLGPVVAARPDVLALQEVHHLEAAAVERVLAAAGLVTSTAHLPAGLVLAHDPRRVRLVAPPLRATLQPAGPLLRWSDHWHERGALAGTYALCDDEERVVTVATAHLIVFARAIARGNQVRRLHR